LDIEILENASASVPADMDLDNEVTKWTGGIDHDPEMDGSDFSWWEDISTADNLESDDSDVLGSSSDEGKEEEDKDEWRSCLQREIEHEIQSLKEPFEQLMEDCM
jgi:hypothetical protein